MNKVNLWLNRDAKWWQFWRPQSGLRGGHDHRASDLSCVRGNLPCHVVGWPMTNHLGWMIATSIISGLLAAAIIVGILAI